jgi:hypothetical protein
VPRRFEVAFGSERAAPELQRGLELGGGLTLSGKIDRIDVDPFGARGVVQDYKSGKSAHSARQIESELRLQIPLYMLVLRDLVGLEPLGGLYRPLAGARKPRGLVRGSETETLPGYVSHDYLDEEVSGASSSQREGRRPHSPSGSGRATFATTRWAVSVLPGATSGPSAGSSDHERVRAELSAEPRAARRGRGRR